MVRKKVPLSLYIPEPKWRAGDPVDFRGMTIPPAGAAARPPVDCTAEETQALAHGLIRVLDEEGAALQAARKRLKALASLDAATRRQRLYAFLARRGYESDVVRRVLAEVLR